MARGRAEGKVRVGSYDTRRVKVGERKGFGEVLLAAFGFPSRERREPWVSLHIDSTSLEARVAMAPAQARELAHGLLAAADAAEAGPAVDQDGGR